MDPPDTTAPLFGGNGDLAGAAAADVVVLTLAQKAHALHLQTAARARRAAERVSRRAAAERGSFDARAKKIGSRDR